MYSYRESHPWITFSATDLNRLDPRTWMLLGEARAACQQLAAAPLPTQIASDLYRVALVRGARATTAIEGNTLTEEQVRGILDETFTAPPSRAYQEVEVRNVFEALEEIANDVTSGVERRITRQLICDYNQLLLTGTDHKPEVVPGELRQHSVVVGNYRGAPAADCDYLIERLAEWLEGDTFRAESPDVAFALTISRAIYAHLYIAWIHPFADGNGRTARLIEFLILARSRLVTLPAAHLLSNHYNLTRDRYYRELETASRNEDALGFVTYAIEGLVDGLREQLEWVRSVQLGYAWVNHVREQMNRFPPGPARDRQQSLVLAMQYGVEYTNGELGLISAELAAAYATMSVRTLSRDLNRLRDAGLVRTRAKKWIARHDVVSSFLPPAVPAKSQDGAI